MCSQIFTNTICENSPQTGMVFRSHIFLFLRLWNVSGNWRPLRTYRCLVCFGEHTVHNYGIVPCNYFVINWWHYKGSSRASKPWTDEDHHKVCTRPGKEKNSEFLPPLNRASNMKRIHQGVAAGWQADGSPSLNMKLGFKLSHWHTSTRKASSALENLWALQGGCSWTYPWPLTSSRWGRHALWPYRSTQYSK